MSLGSNRASGNGRKNTLLTHITMHRVGNGMTMAEALAERKTLSRLKVAEIEEHFKNIRVDKP